MALSLDQELEIMGTKVRLRRRAYQRSMRILVKPSSEVLVTCGRQVSFRHILSFLRENWPWVLRSLNKMQVARALQPQKRMYEGESFLFLGQPRRLSFVSAPVRKFQLSLEPERLWALIPEEEWKDFDQQSEHPHLMSDLRDFFERQGRLHLPSRVKVLADATGLWPSSLSLRCQRTRWGSCSSRGRISLNWRLIAAPEAVIDYVILHELAHLVHRNHSERFWTLVKRHCEDYKTRQQWLRRHHWEMDFLLP